MSAIMTTRFCVRDKAQMLAAIRRGKPMIESQGAEVRWHQVYTGNSGLGDWIITVRYSDWGALAKGRQSLDVNSDYQAVMTEVKKCAEIVAREFHTGIDL
jgi:hypothetical protein